MGVLQNVAEAWLVALEGSCSLAGHVTLAESRGRKAQFLPEGIGEVAVIAVAKIEGKTREIGGTVREAFGRCQSAQTHDISTKT